MSLINTPIENDTINQLARLTDAVKGLPSNNSITTPIQDSISEQMALLTDTIAGAVQSITDGGLWVNCGDYDASGGEFPTTGGSGPEGAIVSGDTWRIDAAGLDALVDDVLRALVDNPGQTSTNWGILQKGIGYTPENVANKSTDDTLGGDTPSDDLYSSQKAGKSYTDTAISNLNIGSAATHDAGDFAAAGAQPAAHAASHATGASDAIAPSDIGAATSGDIATAISNLPAPYVPPSWTVFDSANVIALQLPAFDASGVTGVADLVTLINTLGAGTLVDGGYFQLTGMVNADTVDAVLGGHITIGDTFQFLSGAINYIANFAYTATQLSTLDASLAANVNDVAILMGCTSINQFFQFNGAGPFLDTADTILATLKGNSIGSGDIWQTTDSGHESYALAYIGNSSEIYSYTAIPYSQLQEACGNSIVYGGALRYRDNGDGTATFSADNIEVDASAQLNINLGAFADAQQVWNSGFDISGNSGQVVLYVGVLSILAYCPTTGTPTTNSPQTLDYLQLPGPANISGVVTLPYTPST